jgi:hypothetical protein
MEGGSGDGVLQMVWKVKGDLVDAGHDVFFPLGLVIYLSARTEGLSG